MYYRVTDTELKSIASAIRTQMGGGSSLAFPIGFINGIEQLTYTRNSNATEEDIRYGRTAYVNGTKLTGTAVASLKEITASNSSNKSITTSTHSPGDVFATINIGTQILIPVKANLTDYNFSVKTRSGNIQDLTSHFCVKEITTKTLAGASFVSQFVFAYSESWKPESLLSVTLKLNETAIIPSF